jgi:hypothetical protein
MIKLIAQLLAAMLVTIGAPSFAQTTNLSYPGALERLRASNPDHYEKLRQIAAGLADKPARVESDWLATFGATDVNVGRLDLVLPDLPKQAVWFKLGGSQYRLEVVRTDLNLAIERPQQTLVR